MIKKITNKYYQYETNTFLPIYVEGVLANKNAFHIYKAKRALKIIAKALAPYAQRVDNYFVSH